MLKEGDMGDFLVILYTGSVDVLRSVGTKNMILRKKLVNSTMVSSKFSAFEDEEDMEW